MRRLSRVAATLLAALSIAAAVTALSPTAAQAKAAICRPDEGGGCLSGELIVLNTGGLEPIGSIGGGIKPDPMKGPGVWVADITLPDGRTVFWASGAKTPGLTVPGHTGCTVWSSPPPYPAGWEATCPAPAPWVFSRHDVLSDEDVYTAASLPTLARPVHAPNDYYYDHCVQNFRELTCGIAPIIPITPPTCTYYNPTSVTLRGAGNWWLDDARCKATNGSNVTVVATVEGGLGTATLAADGWISFTPADPYYSGPVTIDVFLKDRLGNRVNPTDPAWTAKVQVTVAPAPTAANDDYTVTAGGTLTVDAAHGLTSNDGFADRTREYYSIQQGWAPPNGTLTLDYATGALVYTPNPGFVGTDTFRYRQNSSLGEPNASNIATVTIHVV
ncbi:Ig-like domain-containing protein [Longispora sp. K20-0274]|uniref:Ig-like domain-containing protein n=1 Tax=Longispora sp. K20-0274 TaxID=3088255 RepID=UPI00399A981B